MKRECIFILLAIIVISTVSSFLLKLIRSGREVKHLLISSVDGKVRAGSFAYWQSRHNGPIWIKLTSTEGDADLYVSDTARPGYEIDTNNFSSVTCGLDAVYIPYYFPRPFGIGVFGHWTYAVSEFSLKVFLDTSPRQVDEWLIYQEIQRAANKGLVLRDEDLLVETTEKEEEQPPPRFSTIFNVLDVIFDMFVL